MGKRAITIDDLTQLKFVGTPKLSPDRRHVVYTMTEMNLEQNGYESALWLAKAGYSPRPLTTFKQKDKLIKDHHPIWSPDGKSIYFLSNRTEKQQVWCLPLEGGEARLITDFEEGVEDFVLSPDGTALICQVVIKEEDPVEKENEDVTIVTRLRYLANGEGFIKGYTHLFLFDLNDGSSKPLTSGAYNARSPRFSPDGRTFVYLKSRPNPEVNGYFNDIYKYDLETGKSAKLYEGKGATYLPTVSPCGKWVAFNGHQGGEVSPKNIGLWILPFEGGDARLLTADWDRPLGNYVGTDASYDKGNDDYQWTEKSDALIFMTTVGGNCILKQITLEGGVSDVLPEAQGVITSFDINGDAIAYVKATPKRPGDVYFYQNGEALQLSQHNQAFFDSVELAEPEFFTFKGADDWEIEGWLLKPPPCVPSKGKIPVVVEIHGGPHTAYGNIFHHEFQCLAANGYAVVYTNPRGSQGYGESFTAACVGDWGGKDYEDIMRGLDAALEKDPELDRDALFVTGGSYGGFMTNTIITKTDRFKAAVTQRCISNIYSFFGTSDIGYYFGHRQLKADQWRDEDKIMAFSPIRHAQNVKTPTCIIHSEEDFRCPIEQAEQWYVALRRLGVETRFVRFKGENHELSRSGKPKNRLTRLHEIVNWFNKYRG
ncbi:S9 family peptidase [Tuberibacillus calidus]|uniref:S9 family peptidase n=1 Tax=Tuberibacillus calidus TaxID=340097 RepID=UPI0003FEE0EA|nr:S9 family peptidase [Tuberibacillus calidus]